MKKIKYQIVVGENGIKDFEKDIEKLFNEGWKAVGGISFNLGYAYQGMAKIIEIADEIKEPQEEIKPRLLGASEAMKRLDELT